VFWWRDGYVWTEEPEPALSVTAERLDAPAPVLHGSKATNAYASDIGSAMLVGVDFPTLGCWKITGKYKEAELSFVVWVALTLCILKKQVEFVHFDTI
jgi:asparagine N-glycosylation enzyme membrane subunit Stt3